MTLAGLTTKRGNQTMAKSLLTRGVSSPKLAKGAEGIESVILHLSPGPLCPWKTNGCFGGCLDTAGRGAMNSVQEARRRRSDLFMTERLAFFARLEAELDLLIKRAEKKNARPVARLNGTSDVPWERIRYSLPQEHYYGLAARSIIEREPGVIFYDYTKSKERARTASLANGGFPFNYSLTLSRSEDFLPGETGDITNSGVNVAVVFDTPKNAELPKTFEGVRVIDGRKSDWRFSDPRGVVVGLSALGKARHDDTGFVVRSAGAK